MKMLKKAGAIAIAGAMALTLGTVSALAADETKSLELGTIPEPTVAEGVMTVKVPYTATGVDQVTLLAEIGTEENTFNNAIAYETTAYIDQESGDGEFEFKINTSRLIPSESTEIDANAEAVYINVKIGGTGIDTPDTGSILVYEKPQDTTPITSDMVANALLKVDGAVETGVFGLDNASIMRLDVQSLVDENKLDLATQVVKIDGVEAAYTTYNGVTKLIALVDTTVETHTIEIVAKDGGATEIKYGDLSGDLAYSPADLSLVITKILETADLTDINDLSRVIGDVNGDVSISPADMSLVISLILDTDGTIVPDANNK